MTWGKLSPYYVFVLGESCVPWPLNLGKPASFSGLQFLISAMGETRPLSPVPQGHGHFLIPKALGHSFALHPFTHQLFLIFSVSGTELDAKNLHLDKAGCLPLRNLLCVRGKDSKKCKGRVALIQVDRCAELWERRAGRSIQRAEAVGRLPSPAVVTGPRAQRTSCSATQVMP